MTAVPDQDMRSKLAGDAIRTFQSALIKAGADPFCGYAPASGGPIRSMLAQDGPANPAAAPTNKAPAAEQVAAATTQRQAHSMRFSI